jgi:hypothetical protein
MPFSLSIVEGCDRSPHKGWSDGLKTQNSNTPIFQLTASLGRLAAEIFLNSLKTKS